MINPVEILRPIYAFGSAMFLWVADVIVPPPDNNWLAMLKELGLPTAGCCLAVWGCTKLSAELKLSQEARIADAKASELARLQDAKDNLLQYRADSEKANESRMAMIHEMRQQTAAIKERSP